MSQYPSYQRAYTALPGLQEEKTVRYVLTDRRTAEGTCYGVRVVEEGPFCAVREETFLFTSRMEQAECLLTHLYENAVPASQCVSVISDACTALHWEEQHGACPHPPAHCG